MSVALRYINRELLAVFVVTLLLLLLVAVGGRFIGYLQEAAMGKFTGSTVLTIIYLRMPEFVQLVAPFAIYVAIVLTLGRLYADQEMVVLHSAGASVARVAGWVSVSLVLVVALVGTLSGWLTPLSQKALSEFMDEQRAQSEFETVNPGIFHIYDRGQRVTYSEAMSADRRELRNVFIAQRLPDGQRVLVWAETGRQAVDPETDAHFLILRNGRRYVGVPGQADMRVIEFEEMKQRLEVNRRPDRNKVEARPTAELGADTESRAEFHWRLGLPLFTLIGGLLALGVSRVKPRQGRFARVVPGMLMMLVYYLAMLLNQNAIVEGDLPSAVGLWPVHGLFGAVMLGLLWRLSKPVRA